MTTNLPTQIAPDPSFWRALLILRNSMIKNCLAQYVLLPHDKRAGHIFESFTIVDNWLDVAIADGWIGADLQ